MISNRWWLLSCVLAALLTTACGTDGWFAKKESPRRPAGTLDASAAAAPRSVALEGTIGGAAYVQGTRFMRVRGYGLVVGLSGQGSRTCPPPIREHVLHEIRRAQSAHPSRAYEQTAEALIESLDTSVVEVTGDIPAGVTQGRRFDVLVSAATVSPDTRSLVGGYLVPCELKIFKEVSPAEVITGRTLAQACGPVFINPFTEKPDGPAAVDPREGTVIGGGENTEDRRLGLVTAIESYSTVRQIMDAINGYGRFASEQKVADAVTPSSVNLTIPPAWRGRENRFLELVLHLPISSSPAVREAKVRALIGELARSGPPPEDTALALEGYGQSVVPLLQELYTNPHPQVSYYAARTGLRLGDSPAIEVLIRHARDARSPFRMAAIAELGSCTPKHRAGVALRELLADDDAQVRIQAYEALREVDPSAVLAASIGGPPNKCNFILDAVSSSGRPLIYARKTKFRRITLIGADRMIVRPPLFYADPRRQVTLSAQANDRFITILRKEAGAVAGEFAVALDAVVLTRYMGGLPTMGKNGKPLGLGLDYAVVFDVLYHLCESGSIDADVKWETQRVEDIIGPLRPVGRPESEL